MVALGGAMLWLVVFAGNSLPQEGSTDNSSMADETNAETLLGIMKAGTILGDVGKVQRVEVSGSRATVTMADAVSEAEAQHICSWTLRAALTSYDLGVMDEITEVTVKDSGWWPWDATSCSL
jgi:hypothetical protein